MNVCQSSMIRNNRKRKCNNISSVENSTDSDSSSLIPNSQGSMDISKENVVHGRRSRKLVKNNQSLFEKSKNKDNCPYQLGNKVPKETILNIWKNEKYFSDLLIYQLFGYNLAKIQLTSS